MLFTSHSEGWEKCTDEEVYRRHNFLIITFLKMESNWCFHSLYLVYLGNNRRDRVSWPLKGPHWEASITLQGAGDTTAKVTFHWLGRRSIALEWSGRGEGELRLERTPTSLYPTLVFLPLCWLMSIDDGGHVSIQSRNATHWWRNLNKAWKKKNACIVVWCQIPANINWSIQPQKLLCCALSGL